MIIKIFFLFFCLLGSIRAADDSGSYPKIIATISALGLDYNLLQSSIGSLNVKDTSNGYGVIASSGFTTSAFIDQVYSQENPLTVLEIGPGDERVLIQLCEDSRNKDKSFTYHFIDLNMSLRKQFQQAFDMHSKNYKNKIGCATERHKGQVLSFLAGKSGTYDAILMNNVSHYLSPIEQLDLFAKIYASLKNGGILYMCQCSVISANIWSTMPSNPFAQDMFITSFNEAKEQGDLWPGYFVRGQVARLILDVTRLCKKNKSAGDWMHPTFHSASTLSLLLQRFGFEIISCMDFVDMPESMVKQLQGTNIASISSVRVGAIVRKTEQLHFSGDLDTYKIAAQSKVDEFEKLTQIYTDENTKDVTPTRNTEQTLLNILRDQVNQMLSGSLGDDKAKFLSILVDIDAAERSRDKSVFLHRITENLMSLGAT